MYEIIKSNRRTLSINIKPDGKVIVRAPFFCKKSQIIDFVNQKQNWIDKTLNQLKGKKSKNKLSFKELKIIKNETLKIVKEKVIYYSKIIGVSYSKISVKIMKTMWGSCSVKGNLNFNIVLSMLPVEIIDYIVVHELCHRKQMNHQKNFWDLVSSFYPNYKSARKFLRENGLKYLSLL